MPFRTPYQQSILADREPYLLQVSVTADQRWIIPVSLSFSNPAHLQARAVTISAHALTRHHRRIGRWLSLAFPPHSGTAFVQQHIRWWCCARLDAPCGGSILRSSTRQWRVSKSLDQWFRLSLSRYNTSILRRRPKQCCCYVWQRLREKSAKPTLPKPRKSVISLSVATSCGFFSQQLHCRSSTPWRIIAASLHLCFLLVGICNSLTRSTELMSCHSFYGVALPPARSLHLACPFTYLFLFLG